MARADFETLLDAYGTDIGRWPLPQRAAAGLLLASDVNARAAMAEAKAFETLLDRSAATAAAAPRDLVDRIVAAAVKPQVVQAGKPATPATIVAAPAPREMPAQNAPLPRRTDAFGVKRLPAAAALAASLVLGIAIGTHDLTHAPMRGLIEMASIEGGDSGIYRLVSSLHSDGLSAALDEDAQ